MPTDWPALPWTVVLRRPRPATKRACTACCPRACSLLAGDRLCNPDVARARFGPRTAFAGIVATLLVSSAAPAQNMRVVATTGDLASLARAVVGDLAQVEAIIPAAADPEAFEPRPSDLARLKGASVVVRVGLGYDHWLDKLLSMHGDAAINRGGAGYVDASIGIPLLEVKGSSVDPANRDGHAHGLANPHYWLDPANAEIITGGIAEAGIRVAPEAGAKIIANRDSFLARLKADLVEWEQLLAPHRLSQYMALFRAPLSAQYRRCDRDQGGGGAKPGATRQTRSDDPRTENTRDRARAVRAGRGITIARAADERGRREACAVGRQRACGQRLPGALRLQCRHVDAGAVRRIELNASCLRTSSHSRHCRSRQPSSSPAFILGLACRCCGEMWCLPILRSRKCRRWAPRWPWSQVTPFRAPPAMPTRSFSRPWAPYC